MSKGAYHNGLRLFHYGRVSIGLLEVSLLTKQILFN